jgi:DNA-binding MarR family transcriptional regulator
MNRAGEQLHLPFDPIERAGEHWSSHFGDPDAMKVVTSVMRVQQLLLSALDSALKPFGITFARYEVLVLLTFSKKGELPLNKIGERLMVHPTSVTNAIDRLESQRLVVRSPDAHDRRKVLARLTDEGREVTLSATQALIDINFALADVAKADLESLFTLLRNVRLAAGDFSKAPSASVK